MVGTSSGADSERPVEPIHAANNAKKRKARIIEPWLLRKGPWQSEKSTPTGNDTTDTITDTATTKPRLGPKRAVCLLFAYNGGQYCGSQLQTGTSQRTVESDLSSALYEAGGIIDDNRHDLSKLKWMRAARTDRGVHAATNAISANLIVEPNDSDFIARVNEKLPAEIRVISVFRVMGSFHAKYSCTARCYHYLVPSYVFDAQFSQHIDTDKARERGEREQKRRQAKESRLLAAKATEEHKVEEPAPKRRKRDDDSEDEIADDDDDNDDNGTEWDDRDNIDITDTLRASLFAYRLSPELRDRVTSLLSRFNGSHNYYNFTRHKTMKDRELKQKWQPIIAKHESLITAALTTTEVGDYESQKAHAAEQRKTSIPVNKDFNAARNNRYMKDVSIDSVVTVGGMEFVRVKILGQSFMLNQIRKMVGLVIGVARRLIDESVFERVFSEAGFHLPTAPALGLYLNRMYFNGYDKKCRESKAEDRETVEAQVVANEAMIDKFRHEFIYPAICDTEAQTLAAYRWLASLGLHVSMTRGSQASASQ